MKATENFDPQRPMISVILAVFNEADYIQPCLRSLLGQETLDFDLEVVAVDGGSTDGTREYLESVAEREPRLRILDNPERRAPFAFNLGLREALGECVCIFGAHTVYAPDYIAVCLTELRLRGVAGCGGRLQTQPSANTVQARLVALALAHPYGTSRTSVRTRPEGFSTAAFMVLRKAPLLEVGGYSEAMSRNQDNDTYQKLEALGYKFYCTWKTQCIYYPKGSIKDILTYAFRSGYWNAISMVENPHSMAARHFAPFGFVLGLLLATLFLVFSRSYLPPLVSAVPLVFIVGLHFFCGSLAATQVLIREKFLAAVALPFVFFGFHFSYGWGTLWAFVTGAKARAPGGHAISTGKAISRAAGGD